MRFFRYMLLAVVAGGVMLVPAAASASTTINCANKYMPVCTEIDAPGSENTASGEGLPSQVATGAGTYCLTPYYSGDGTVDVAGDAFVEDIPLGPPQDVYWRVWFSTSPTMSNEVKVYKDEDSSVRSPVAGPGAGWFQGCVVNYDEDNPPVQFSIGIFQS